MMGERHGLLELDVDVRGTVHEVEHLVVQMLDLVVNVGLGVAFVVRRHIRQSHVPLGVRGVCVTTMTIIVAPIVGDREMRNVKYREKEREREIFCREGKDPTATIEDSTV